MLTSINIASVFFPNEPSPYARCLLTTMLLHTFNNLVLPQQAADIPNNIRSRLAIPPAVYRHL